MIRTALFSTIALLMSAGTAHGDLFLFTGTLDGGQEVPSNMSAATGDFTALFDDVTGDITINGTFTGLEGGNATMAHLHGFSSPGVNAPVLFGLTVSPSTSGVFSGNNTIAAGDIPSVLAGLTYINIHNGDFPGGEIRGQLSAFIVVPEPATSGLAGLACLALVRLRRGR